MVGYSKLTLEQMVFPTRLRAEHAQEKTKETSLTNQGEVPVDGSTGVWWLELHVAENKLGEKGRGGWGTGGST